MVGLSVSLKCDLKDNSFLYLPEGSIKDIDKLLSKNQSGFLESDILETMQDSYFKKIFFNIVKIQIQREFSCLMTSNK